MEAEKRVLLEKDDVQRTISRMAHEIVEKNGGAAGIALVGIRSRGAQLARRIARKIETLTGASPAMGVVDVRPYRDDVARSAPGEPPRMDVPVAIDDRTVVLVDDVINTGRTIRAALEMLDHLGKPQKILVATLVDRGDRELPIRADIVGKNVKVDESERVNVLLEESDGADLVIVAGAKKAS
ncbi:MAG TPA: bifunctional pyr operon transcriptional regulator/uracil phosphoribosyltransferase PyrR [Verrucomicrobiae bacterium]|jgi:pyrimidine operon attenuation protein / uracil phosphoribosyltransferase|nr:bifunctional pyr operon transcriptional regulator/uracil phosphoribosyltransferase PyrR [Verrucomicrobiae bacterium]